ncbi:MAG: DeoR/GlpR family DNA-binding transcription regulator [Nocardioidaceae bacterium]|nr:DeoR/GlpR family DNA-binding transcription regulator [Nocardioidaceae bacterium]MCL2613586.1 DeoR/GlpR family DNA-binding transcription regulator [Nocardioidaceae bacterium]
MTDRDVASADERRRRITAIVDGGGFASVADISEAVGVSSVTVRGDLDALDRLGLLRRIRGGALSLDPAALPERPFEETEGEAAGAKAAIAARAAQLVQPGMCVLLDVGTTCAAVARELLHREDLHDVTVITSGLSIALALEPAIPRLQVVVTGGTLRPLQHSLVAPLGTLLLEHVRADLAVVGCNGVDAEAGITNINLPEAEVKRAMIAASSSVAVVADGSKIGRARLGVVAPASEVDWIVTDDTAPAEALAALTALDAPEIAVAGSARG